MTSQSVDINLCSSDITIISPIERTLPQEGGGAFY